MDASEAGQGYEVLRLLVQLFELFYMVITYTGATIIDRVESENWQRRNGIVV